MIEDVKKYGEKIRKENAKQNIKNVFITFFIVCSGFVIYKLSAGEFIPFIHKTAVIKAEIIKVQKYNWGKGVHKYIMTYEFLHDGKKYDGKYDLWKNIDKKGDSVFVRYATSNPKLNEVE